MADLKRAPRMRYSELGIVSLVLGMVAIVATVWVPPVSTLAVIGCALGLALGIYGIGTARRTNRRPSIAVMGTVVNAVMILTVVVFTFDLCDVWQRIFPSRPRCGTIIAQDKLSAAIEAYRKVTGEYPKAANIDALLATLQGKGLEGARRDELRKQTMPYPGAKPSELLMDVFGNKMRYYAKGGLGGKPVIVSAGRDGDFGDADPEKRDDNIRSDTRGTAGTTE